MSVIIRLQNLPWSANALDIRQFFKGLSIPEGGVHIVGGENGDAFIAFSTDEDARQAMMHDREKLNEVQVRLLLSSRAEMQKVIETARQQSMLALQNAGAIPAPKIVSTPLPIPQPPVITSNSLQTILSNQLSAAAPSFLAYQKQAGITLAEKPEKVEKPDVPTTSLSSTSRRDSRDVATRDRRRSSSRDRRRSRSRDRNTRNDRAVSRRRGGRERSHSRSREHDWKDGSGRGRNSSRRSKSRDRMRERSRERGSGDGERGDRERSRSNRGGSSKGDKDSNPFSSRSGAGGNKSSNTFRGGSGIEAHDTVKPKAPAISPWSIPPVNAYQTNFSIENSATNSPSQLPIIGAAGSANLNSLLNVANVAGIVRNMSTVMTPNAYTTTATSKTAEVVAPSTIAAAAAAVLPAFQNYSTTTATSNNYSINLLGGTNSNSSDSIRPFALQNPYTAAVQAAANINSNSQESNGATSQQQNVPNTLISFPGDALQQQQGIVAPPANFLQTQQEPIAFANTNPYAQMYPNLFAQAAALGVTSKVNTHSQMAAEQEPSQRKDKLKNPSESCSIKINNMCGSTTYSDLRKFFAGLFVPHNGIKMVNDKHGLRIGVAYIQFSRVSSVQKALVRNNTMLKTKRVTIEAVSDEEFEQMEDSFRPAQRSYDRNERIERPNYGDRPNSNNNRNNDSDSWREDNNGNNMSGSGNTSETRINPFNLDRKQQQNHHQQPREPFNVLYIEDIPTLTTEQDIMKMFSSFTIYDILLISNPENRREFIAHVKFSRDEEAKAALLDKSRHMIGYRKVRVRAGRSEDMDKAKEKLRLANEQLRKEELAQAAEEEAKEAAENEEKQRREDAATAAAAANTIVIDHDDDEDDDVQMMPPNMQDGPSDPRLRRQQGSGPPPTDRFERQPDHFNQNSNHHNNNNKNNSGNDFMGGPQNFNNNNSKQQHPNNNMNFNDIPHQLNAIEHSFIIMKNCDYNTHIDEVADLFMSSNLRLKHIEPLRNERGMPTGEFIVEFRDPRDAEIAVNEFNNTQFRQRNLRVRPIVPQQIADILGKPFLNYFPGGGRNGPPPFMQGGRGGGGGGGFEFFGRGGGGGMGGGGPPPGNMMNFRGGGGPNMGMAGPNMRFGGNNMPMRGGRGGGGMPPFGMPVRGMRGGRGGGRGGMMDMGRGGGNGSGANFGFNNQQMDRDDDSDVEEIVDKDSDDIDEHDENDDEENLNAANNDVDDDNGNSASGGDGRDDDDDGAADIDNDNDVTIANVGDDDNNGGAENDAGGIPEVFSRPGCVVAMGNLPFKADLPDILRFFSDYKLTPEDIIRRFSDDGKPTGDARVAFPTPALARAAFESCKRKYIFNRAIYLSIL